MPKPYSSGISPERHESMMSNVEARAERREEQLAALPVHIGQIFRGRRRDSHAPQTFFPALGETTIEDLGRRFNRIGGIIESDFTKNIPVITDSLSYQRYITGGNKNNRRTESNPEEKEQARMARMRQTQHIADRLHREVWIELEAARLLKVASEVVKEDVLARRKPSVLAARIGSSALEDLGFSLIESGMYKKIHNGGVIARGFVDIAQHTTTKPEVFNSQPASLMLLVQREQERRETQWGDLLDMYEQPIEDGWGGMRRTQQDLEDEQYTNSIIEELRLRN